MHAYPGRICMAKSFTSQCPAYSIFLMILFREHVEKQFLWGSLGQGANAVWYSAWNIVKQTWNHCELHGFAWKPNVWVKCREQHLLKNSSLLMNWKSMPICSDLYWFVCSRQHVWFEVVCPNLLMSWSLGLAAFCHSKWLGNYGIRGLNRKTMSFHAIQPLKNRSN